MAKKAYKRRPQRPPPTVTYENRNASVPAPSAEIVELDLARPAYRTGPPDLLNRRLDAAFDVLLKWAQRHDGTPITRPQLQMLCREMIGAADYAQAQHDYPPRTSQRPGLRGGMARY